MKIFIQKHIFFERHTGDSHEVIIYFSARRVYEVYVDGEFYATAEHLLAAHQKIMDVIQNKDWAPIRPV